MTKKWIKKDESECDSETQGQCYNRGATAQYFWNSRARAAGQKNKHPTLLSNWSSLSELTKLNICIFFHNSCHILGLCFCNQRIDCELRVFVSKKVFSTSVSCLNSTLCVYSRVWLKNILQFTKVQRNPPHQNSNCFVGNQVGGVFWYRVLIS